MLKRLGWAPAPRTAFAACLLAASLFIPSSAGAYSVLAHEAGIDALWRSNIEPLIKARFPNASEEEVKAARAYAYGGSVIQDVGYYPFGSRFVSNLLHYVRTGDFIEQMLHDAADANQYAFALGALAHYAADTTGHPVAVNRAVPLVFPKLRKKYGDVVTYEDSPARHVIVEFSFDVVEVAGGAYLPEAYHAFIGFQVSKPLLEQAFREIYGLDMKEVFGNEDLALATYRHALSDIVPELTRVAWKHKQKEIRQLQPAIDREHFVFNVDRAAYEREYGTNYQKPGLFARLLGFLYKLLPKIGPLKPLSFEAPTPEAENLFLGSLVETRERIRRALVDLERRRLNLTNMNFDIGRATARGEYRLADETYCELLHKLADRRFAGVPAALRRDLNAFYAKGPAARDKGRREKKIRVELARLNAVVE